MGRFEATITSKGQITVPSRLRSALHLKPGDKIVFVEEAGSYRIEPQAGTLNDLRGIVRAGPDAITTAQVGAWIEESRGEHWNRSTTAEDE